MIGYGKESNIGSCELRRRLYQISPFIKVVLLMAWSYERRVDGETSRDLLGSVVHYMLVGYAKEPIIESCDLRRIY